MSILDMVIIVVRQHKREKRINKYISVSIFICAATFATCYVIICFHVSLQHRWRGMRARGDTWIESLLWTRKLKSLFMCHLAWRYGLLWVCCCVVEEAGARLHVMRVLWIHNWLLFCSLHSKPWHTKPYSFSIMCLFVGMNPAVHALVFNTFIFLMLLETRRKYHRTNNKTFSSSKHP